MNLSYQSRDIKLKEQQVHVFFFFLKKNKNKNKNNLMDFKSRGFIKGLAAGKLTGCEDDFACLV